MTFKKIGIILFLIFSLFPINKILAQNSNTGFVSGNIWYSKDPFEEGDKIKIYTFVFNPDTKELSGTVIFFDKTIMLGKKDFVIPAKGADDVSIDWTVTAGDHTIFGKIENSKFLVSKGKYEDVYLPDNETEKSSHTVSKKVAAVSADKTIDSAVSSVSNIGKTIEEATPDFIAKPLTSTTNVLENFRQDTNISSENKKIEVQKDIDSLNNVKNPSTNSNNILKPFKYVELFFLTIFNFILGNKIVFYVILVLILFFILRFVWKKIF